MHFYAFCFPCFFAQHCSVGQLIQATMIIIIMKGSVSAYKPYISVSY